MEIINEQTGEVLQSKVFQAYSNENDEWYQDKKGGISMNDFLKAYTDKIHSIVPLHVGRYGRIMIFYYDKLGE